MFNKNIYVKLQNEQLYRDYSDYWPCVKILNGSL